MNFISRIGARTPLFLNAASAIDASKDELIDFLAKLIDDPGTSDEDRAKAEELLRREKDDPAAKSSHRDIAYSALRRAEERDSLARRMGIQRRENSVARLEGRSHSFPVLTAADAQRILARGGR